MYWEEALKFRLVSFDFDHTLTKGVTAAEHLADFLGVRSQVDEFEQLFRSGEMTTSEFTDATAHLLAGQRVDEITDHLEAIPMVSGVSKLVSWLRRQNIRVVLNTIGYRDVIVPLASELGFHDVSGVELEHDNFEFSGRVNSYFPLENKIAFAQRQVHAAGGQLKDVIAVGDGLSDIPLFNAVGASIAFNADEYTEKVSTLSAMGETCEELYYAFNALLGN